MKFFNLDCHISVISDIKNIFESLGHEVDHWSLSGHRWVFDFEKCQSPIINESNWTNLNQEMVDRFYEHHKKDLDGYDAFICAYPPCFLKLFEKFNKPIIVIAATRYDHPFTNDKTRLDWLEDSLKNNKYLILITNNEFDKKYCEHFLGNEWQWIPSLCDYTGAEYNPIKKQYILFSKFDIQRDPNVIHQNQLGKYTWEDLYSYNGIIHLPYNVSTMSIFEQYQAGVPLNFPSLDFAIELVNSQVPIFSEITFPNNQQNRQKDIFLTKEWLQYSDFYNGTIKCNYFDSSFNLTNSVKTLKNIDYIYNQWESILKRI